MRPSIFHQKTEVQGSFQNHFKAAPRVVARAPGRVNLIGEHTDYNGGFVLPAAIDREVLIAADKGSKEGVIELYSTEYNQFDTFSTDNIQLSTDRSWSNYVRGIVVALQKQNHKINGFRAVIAGNVPQGAGLSSSAALEVATCKLLSHLEELNLGGKEIALIAQKAENEFVGVNCGIMDQFVSALAVSDAALMIDCRDLSYEAIPLHLSSHSISLVITHTGISRELVESKYNERRSECEEAVRLLSQQSGNEHAESLRDVSSEVLNANSHNLPAIIARRARHVVSENERVKRAAVCLRAGLLHEFGELMVESHNSLRNDYEVSCMELNTLVELALEAGALGARMTGAGFGGCTVALMPQEKVENYVNKTLPQYKSDTGRSPSAYICKAVKGTEII